MMDLIVSHDNYGSRNKYVRFLLKIFPNINISMSPIKTTGKVFVYGDGSNSWEFFHKHSIPYILCENDIASLRYIPDKLRHKVLQNEKNMIEHAERVVFPSEDFQKYISKTYKCPKSIVVHLRYSYDDIKFTPLDKKEKTMVYCGGINSHSNHPYSYRNYLEIFNEFIKHGWDVHLYPIKNKHFNEYKKIGCIIHDTLEQEFLYKEISQYTIGFQGYNKIDVPKQSYQYTQICRPNKLWEYLAAGIPTIGFQGGAGMEIYKDKWGIVLDNLKDIPTIEERIKNLDIEKYRNEEVIEKDIKRFSKFLQI